MSYHGDRDSRSYEGLGNAGYQKPFPDGKSPHPPQTYQPQPEYRPEEIRMELTPEEKVLAAEIRRKHNIITLFPFTVGSFFGLKFLDSKGILKAKFPYYVGATFFSFVASKFLTYKDFKKQAMEKYPNGVVAQTRNMNPAQQMEYFKQKRAQMNEEAALKAPETPKFNPDSRNDIKGLDDRFRPNVDSYDTQPRQVPVEDPKEPMKKQSYASLRQQAHKDEVENKYNRLSGPYKPNIPQRQDKPNVDDPSQQLSRGKRNKYGDEME